MAYCPPQLLDDLTDVLARMRTWVGIVEMKPGVFYAHGQPFLHFHLLAGGRRRADIKGCTTWAQLDLPRPATAGGRRALVRQLRLRYAEKAGTRSRRGFAPTSRPTERSSHRSATRTR